MLGEEFVMRKIFIVVIGFLGLMTSTLIYAALASPADLACLMARTGMLENLSDGSLVEDTSSPEQRGQFADLQDKAKARIEEKFGVMRSRSKVVFFQTDQTFWPLKINSYGSAAYAGNCVLVGPQGQNVDVVAHELMHQELRTRIGYWRMFTQVPIWFDEGLAMQVDLRPQYGLTPAQKNLNQVSAIRSLTSARQFHQGDDEKITENYAFAKAEVARWLEDVGHQSLYPRLDRIREGESFDSVTNAQQKVAPEKSVIPVKTGIHTEVKTSPTCVASQHGFPFSRE
jgi:hypothetical protein